MSMKREFNQPAPLEALFRTDTVRFEFTEEEDDHNAFVMSLSQLAQNLQAAATPAGVPQPLPRQ